MIISTSLNDTMDFLSYFLYQLFQYFKPCDSVNWSYTFSLFCSIWKPRWWKEPLFYIKKKIPFHLIFITSFYMHENFVCTGNNNTFTMCIVGLYKWKCYWVYLCAGYHVPSSGHILWKLYTIILAKRIYTLQLHLNFIPKILHMKRLTNK